MRATASATLPSVRRRQPESPTVPITTSFTGEHGLLKTLNCFEWAKHLDFVSFNSAAELNGADPADVAFSLALQRGLGGGKPWVLMEQASNPANLRSHPVTRRPGQTRLWGYQAVGHGADGVLFYQWRAPRSGVGKFQSAMLPHGGPDTRLFREVEQLGLELRLLAPVCGGRTPAEVALMVDWENYWAIELEARPTKLDYSELVRSYYRALFEPDIAIDIVAPESDLSPYKLVIAPSLYLVRDAVAENLERFVDRGGTLVMTFFSGIVDANDRVMPGGYPGPFRRLLGIQVEEMDPFPPGLVRHIKTAERAAKCSLWADAIRLETAEAVATFTEDHHAGQPAITRNAHGRGLAYYVGTQVEHSFLRIFFAELCADSGIKAPLKVPEGVEVLRRENENGQFLFLINHRPTVQFVDLGRFLGRDMLSGEMLGGQFQIKPRDLVILQVEEVAEGEAVLEETA